MIQLTDKLAVTADNECYIVGKPIETVTVNGEKRSKTVPQDFTLLWHKQCVGRFLSRLDRKWLRTKSPPCQSLCGRKSSYMKNLLRDWRT